MNISNLIWNFLQEIISHSDNNPTKFSVISYGYFQLIYNIGTLFEINGIESKDRVSPLKNRIEIRKFIIKLPKTNQNELLQNYLYHAHTFFISKLYSNVKILSARDYGITKVIPIERTILDTIKEYAESHILGKQKELERAMFATKNITGISADYTGTQFKENINDVEQNGNWDKWQPLAIPTGAVKGPNNLPMIDPTNPLSYKIQNFLGLKFNENNGFAVNPSEYIIDLDSKVSKTWDGGLKKEIDLLLDVYKNLTEEQKIIAEFFAGSSKNALPPPGMLICIAMQLSQKYQQSLLNDLKMYFSLAAGLFDACTSAWYYKAMYQQARPVTLIRTHYKDKQINSWTPLSTEKSAEITGSQWLPYQPLNFVTPAFSDFPSGHTVFSNVAAQILKWWFNDPILYDGCFVATTPNQQVLCPSLNLNDKMVCIGEYNFDIGCSEVEPGVSPKSKITLRYKNLEDFAEAAGMSRIYGGIHTTETNRVSAELAVWVFKQTQKKLINDFRFQSPYT